METTKFVSITQGNEESQSAQENPNSIVIHSSDRKLTNKPSQLSQAKSDWRKTPAKSSLGATRVVPTEKSKATEDLRETQVGESTIQASTADATHPGTRGRQTRYKEDTKAKSVEAKSTQNQGILNNFKKKRLHQIIDRFERPSLQLVEWKEKDIEQKQNEENYYSRVKKPQTSSYQQKNNQSKNNQQKHGMSVDGFEPYKNERDNLGRLLPR